MTHNMSTFIAWLGLLITVVMISSCGGSSSSNDINLNGSSSGMSTPEQSNSNYARLAQLRKTSGVTQEFALAQFVAHFGPLQQRPDLSYDNSMPLFSTHVIEEVLEFKDQLNPALLTEIYQRILPINSTTGATNTGKGEWAVRKADPDLQQLAQGIAEQLGQRLNRTLQSQIEVIRVSSATDLGYPEGQARESTAFAFSPEIRRDLVKLDWLKLADLELKSVDSCWIVINEHASVNQFDDASEKEKLNILAHEVTHCFQYEMRSATPPGWVTEGTASWVGQAYAGGTTSDIMERMWDAYEEPEYNMFSDFPYASIGFWSHVSNSINGELWSILPTIFESSTEDSAASLRAVREQITAENYTQWPAGRMNRPDWGSEWQSIGVGGRDVSTEPKRIELKTTAAYGESKLLSLLPPLSNGSRPVILDIQSEGVGLMHWKAASNNIEFGGSEPLHFCMTQEECVCENGTPLDGYENVVDAPLNVSLIIAMTGQEDQTESSFEHQFIDVLANCPADSVIPPKPIATPQARIDECMVGQWNLDLAFMENQIWGDELDNNFTPGMLSGDISVDLQNNGRGQVLMDLTILNPTEQGSPSFVVKTNGAIDFDWWTTNDNTLFNKQDGESDIVGTVIVDGMQLPISYAETPITNENVIGSSGENGAKYSCTPDAMLIASEGDGAYDIRYIRQR